MPKKKSKIRYSKVPVLILGLSLICSYIFNKMQVEQQMLNDAKQLNVVISEPIEGVATMTHALGRKIANHDKYEDLDYINDLFVRSAQIHAVPFGDVSWALFSWGDKKHRLSVNTLDGVSEPKSSLVSRSYTWRSKFEPWKLQFSAPDRGRLSKIWLLPVAMGVSNQRDEFQGTIISGINLKKISNKANMALHSSNSFILANRDIFNQDANKIIIASPNTPKEAEDYKRLPKLVEEYRDWMKQDGGVLTEFTAGRFKYEAYSMLEGHPLIIFVGYDRVQFWWDVFVKALMFIIFTVALDHLFSRKEVK